MNDQLHNSVFPRSILHTCSGDREGEERSGPRVGRGTKERDGESKDGGGQRKHVGNAWSKGKPRILSNDGPPQMKKYEEPQMPVSLSCVRLQLPVCTRTKHSLTHVHTHTHTIDFQSA